MHNITELHNFIVRKSESSQTVLHSLTSQESQLQHPSFYRSFDELKECLTTSSLTVSLIIPQKTRKVHYILAHWGTNVSLRMINCSSRVKEVRQTEATIPQTEKYAEDKRWRNNWHKGRNADKNFHVDQTRSLSGECNKKVKFLS